MGYLHPALRTLARLKLRGYVRRAKRRLSRPSGVLFALVGLGMMALWLTTIVIRSSSPVSFEVSPEVRAGFVAGALLALTVLVLVSSLSHRGLYLPADEIERLLSAPVSRADLVRYRILTNLSRSLLFGLILGFVAAPRMPVAGFAFAGTFVATMTLPLVGQTAALICGDAENRIGRLLTRLPIRSLRVLGMLVFWAFVMFVVFGDELISLQPEHQAGPLPERIVAHPAYRAVTFPFGPWATAITAESWNDFLPWFGGAVLVWCGLFEAAARIPIDFRSLSLETSADVASRLARLRSGRNMISGGAVTKRALGWKVPWLFGRGPFGAIAWLKLCAILRKARGTLLFSTFVIALLVVLSTLGSAGDVEEIAWVGPFMIALLGTIYLGSGLRFDFRSDLDLMAVVKAWPLPASRIFLATILPEVVLVSILIVLAILVRAAILASFSLPLVAALTLVPLIATLWISLDNAVFLIAPVRFVPGQGSAMQHTGRAMVLVFLRLVVLGALAAVAALGVFLSGLVAEWLGLAEPARVGLAAGTVVLVLGFGIVGCVSFGAWALGRFDVARERAATT